jgi:5-methylcytosine-specific restriction endonuclease McrA
MVARNKYGIKKTNEEVFVENSTYPRHRLKERIIKEEMIPYVCHECGMDDIWNGKKIVLQLDHINGVNDDNRLENLQFLCPNCHSQTHTYAAKNRHNSARKPKRYV